MAGELEASDLSDLLAEEGGLTARELRARLARRDRANVTRKDVNRVLYAGERKGYYRRSEETAPRWWLGPGNDEGATNDESPPGEEDDEHVRLLFDALE